MSRRRNLEEEEDELSDLSSTASSQGSKRRRLNGDVEDEESEGELLPDSFRRSPRKHRHGAAIAGAEKHQAGSLVRIAVKNFVTYTRATFNCGPSLNMIIGPNGTGKSTLVCAICLGLGYKPSVLGRAKNIGEFVKHGSKEARIEVELAAKPGQRENTVIQHTITREGNKSAYKINGKVASHKEVMACVKSFNIQIDNLCQFLPQDRVVEFAQMTPVGLLESTQKAAAREEMEAWHVKLKILGQKRIEMQAKREEDLKQLDALEKRHAQQQVEVDRMRERQTLLTRLQALEMTRPALQYAQEKNKHDEMRRTKRQYEAELRDLTQQVAPALQETEQKEIYVRQLKEAVDEADRISKRFETEIEKKAKDAEDKANKISALEVERNAEINNYKKRIPEIQRLDREIKQMEDQRAEEPAAVDGASYNARIREKDLQIRELVRKAEDIKAQEADIKARAEAKSAEFAAIQNEIRDLQSASGQQTRKLMQASPDTLEAYKWLQTHQAEFKEKIYGPPLVECSVRDPRYAGALESLLMRGDFLTFTATNKDDWNKFRQICQNQLRLKDIHSKVAPKPLSFWESPMAKEALAEYGLDEFASDLLQGPEPVLSMLCDAVRLHRTGVSLHDSTEEQFERLQNSPIQSWVAGKNSYRVNRRREYGPSAVSTVVSQVRPAQFWNSSGGGDVEAIRQAQRKLRDIEVDAAELQEELQPIRQKLNELKEQRESLEDEKQAITTEKLDRQKARSEWEALPRKIQTMVERREEKQRHQNEIHDRLRDIAQRKQGLLLERAQLAIDHTIALERSMQIYEEMAELEIQLVEGESELGHLIQKSQRVRDMLEQRRVEIRDFEARIKEQTVICKRLVKEIQDAQRKRATLENGEQLEEIMTRWLQGLDLETGQPTDDERTSVEHLDGEIVSTRQRIELMHEGNPRIFEQFEQRGRDIEKVKDRIANFQTDLDSLNAQIDDLRRKWEPELDELVEKISAAFSHNFERIGCAGQVRVRKDDHDFREWAIQIEVKFRENEELAVLDSHRQSGGERAVSTIFYLMALQSMARSPFRVVDEINQGMDPRNERMVHERMVDIACSENTSQYFLVTPKLLNGLKYHPRMVVHVIYSGEEMPEAGSEGSMLDLSVLAQRARELGRVH
ncbi:uncharacterized protein PV09_00059 [Verruconis gallopava]|uniref:Structural maintenance of chromosomes protein 5 n=1 Tax=Verruconis gallopava TaxID=253628 RepID=A0A0D2ARI6_9PEZI|nr:uncharacterized protein PV09_00059 [Verruconis gallopava]KIW09115.1 hypothetical protein PV09_00059 [Verruconis gallopava]